MELGEGLLTLKVEEGKLTRDTEMIGSMSPYCTMVFKGHKLKTKVHSYGGKTPVWGDEFVLDVLEHTEELVLRVWDQDTTTSDAIGWCKVKMSSLIINNGVGLFSRPHAASAHGVVSCVPGFAGVLQ